MSAWLSLREVMTVTGWTDRTIHRKAAANEIKSRTTGEISGNGKAIREYAAASLPADAQLKLMTARIASTALVPVKQSIHAHASLPEPRSERVVMALEALDPEAREQAQTRLKLISPLIDFVNKTNGHKPVFKSSASGEEFTTLSGLVKHLAKISQNSERSIWVWWTRYKESGPGALADAARSDAGKSRFFREHPDAAEFCRNKYLNERLSISLVHRALLREWHRFRKSDDDQAADYKTLRVYLQREISPLVKMVARENDKAFHDKAAPYIIRDISKVRCNQYWISDHMIHDVWVRNDRTANGALVFPELEENMQLRPWLTCIVDMRSRRVMAPMWCATPSSRSVGSALLLGMRLFGRPEVFYIDNGKDYNRLSDDANGVLMRLGIQSQHCLPKHPQSKQIESFFRTVHQQFDVLWRPYYSGTSPATVPDDCRAMLREHQKLMKHGEGERSPLPLASEFLTAAARYLDEFNESAHTGQGMNGRSPNEVYDAELPADLRQPVNPADVAQLFWERDTRKVCEGGCVRLDKFRFEPADAESYGALMQRVDTEVIVARDPRNLSEAIILSNEREPKYLGWVKSQEMAVHGETDRDMIRLRMRKEGRARTAIKQYLAAMAHTREAAGDLTEIESLQRRAKSSGVKPNIYALPVPRAVNAVPAPRHHAEDIADSYSED